METLDHSMIAARSRRIARSVVKRSREAASARYWAFPDSSCGGVPPTAWGQKYCSWRRAAAWKVRVCTPAAPSPCRRARISLAARAVKVRASTCWGT